MSQRDFQITIEKKELLPQDLISVLVRRDVWAPAVFELRLRRQSGETTPHLWDEKRFNVGSPVEIAMRYMGGLKPVMKGEITGLELDFRSGEELLTVRGHDRGHRLLRGRKTRAFPGKKDSDIARDVAKAAGLTSAAEDTKVTLEHVLQHNQTDWEFLQQRARDLGFEVRVEGTTLFFQPHKNDGAEALELQRESSDLLEFRPRLSTVGLVGKVVVQGWSPTNKEAITGGASSRDQGSLMDGLRSGLETADNAFGKAIGTIVDRPVLSQAEAAQIARGRLKEMALAYIAGEGVAIGRADLDAGKVVRIAGFGPVFNGLYYVVSVCHTYVPGPGYRTAFAVRRSAS